MRLAAREKKGCSYRGKRGVAWIGGLAKRRPREAEALIESVLLPPMASRPALVDSCRVKMKCFIIGPLMLAVLAERSLRTFF